MKKNLYLFAIMFFALTLFVSAPAKAVSSNSNNNSDSLVGGILNLLGLGSNNNNNNNNKDKHKTSTALPINNGVEFLMIAGVIIGITSVNKAKKLKTAY
jgi:hypothetical protein